MMMVSTSWLNLRPLVRFFLPIKIRSTKSSKIQLEKRTQNPLSRVGVGRLSNRKCLRQTGFPGVGLKTANEIIELRMSLPGERFSKLEQLRQIKHINWDEILSDAIYVE
jgi:hypothetical protein